jgi:hypothetical protein
MSSLWKLLLSRVGGVKHKMVIKLALVFGSSLEELHHLLPSSIVQIPCCFFYLYTYTWLVSYTQTFYYLFEVSIMQVHYILVQDNPVPAPLVEHSTYHAYECCFDYHTCKDYYNFHEIGSS